MATTTYILTGAQKRNLLNSLLSFAEGADGQVTTEEDMITYGVDTLEFPEPVVKKAILELQRKGYFPGVVVAGSV